MHEERVLDLLIAICVIFLLTTLYYNITLQHACTVIRSQSVSYLRVIHSIKIIARDTIILLLKESAIARAPLHMS